MATRRVRHHHGARARRCSRGPCRRWGCRGRDWIGQDGHRHDDAGSSLHGGEGIARLRGAHRNVGGRRETAGDLGAPGCQHVFFELVQDRRGRLQGRPRE